MHRENLCDLIVDDLYCDSFGGMLALEGAALSKPVLVAGYGKMQLECTIPEYARLPVVFCLPSDFDTTLESLIASKKLREDIGRNAFEFFKQWAQPEHVAHRLLTVARGEGPAEWMFDPFTIDYCDGVGGTRREVCAAIEKVVNTGGSEALCLAEKPSLVSRLLASARREAA